MMRFLDRRPGVPGQLTPAIVLLVLCGNLLLAGMAALWLQIPDSHAWQFVASMVLGLAIVCGFLLLYATVLRRLRLGAAAGVRSIEGIGLLAVWLVVWRVLAGLVGRMSVQVVERAGFWNSRLSPHQRNIFTEPRLAAWQNEVIATLLWFVLPGLLLPLIVETVSRGLRGAAGETSPLRAVTRVYGRWQLWLVVGVASVLACSFVEKLDGWRTYDTVRGELVSLVLRLGLGYVVLTAFGLAVLAWIARLLARSTAGPRA